MNPYDLLLTYAEVGVALAGFGGIVAAFRQRDRGLSPFDISSIRFVLEVSLSTILFAVIPGVLENLAVSEALAWRISALLLATGLIALLVYQARRRRQLVDEIGTPPSAVRGRSILLGLYVALSAAVGISGLVGYLTPGFYLLGTGMLLVAAGIEFLAFAAALQEPQ